jgi:hypothetical protein
MVRRSNKARGLTTGKRVRLVPGYTARRPTGRATGGSAGNETQGRAFAAWQKLQQETFHGTTRDRD